MLATLDGFSRSLRGSVIVTTSAFTPTLNRFGAALQRISAGSEGMINVGVDVGTERVGVEEGEGMDVSVGLAVKGSMDIFLLASGAR
jgi:hypothetical protein